MSPEDQAEALETLEKRLKHCKEISFTQDSDGRDNTYLAIATKASKGDEAKQIRLKLAFKGDDDAVELGKQSKQFLENQLVACLKKNADKIQNVKYVTIDDRLPDFINVTIAIFIEKKKPLKKLVFDSCGSQRDDGPSIFDATLLRQVCELCEEFHIDYEDHELSNPHDLPLFLSVLGQVNLLKVVSFSYTFCDDTTQLVHMLESNTLLTELILYNAFSGITKSALNPLVDAMKKHPSLKKFTLLHSKLHSSIYKWAVTTILDNKNIVGFCTDGYYSRNATWLGRFLGANDQVTEVNLSHPSFEDDYDRVSSRGAALSLIQGLSRNTTLKSVKLVGIPMEAEVVQAMRTLIEMNETFEKLACGTTVMRPSCFSVIIGGMLSNTTIKKLSIQARYLDPVGAQTVADILASNVTLESLSIGTHRCRYPLRSRARTSMEVDPADPSQAVALLVAGLRQNTTLKYLTLPASMYNSSCVEHFCGILQTENQTLERLTFWPNRFWPKVPCKIPRLQYLTLLNRCGRQRLFHANVPNALWAHVLAAKPNADLVRYFVNEKPVLFDYCAEKRQQVENSDHGNKRAKHA